jgi:hypothetical protein
MKQAFVSSTDQGGGKRRRLTGVTPAAGTSIATLWDIKDAVNELKAPLSDIKDRNREASRLMA